jgi:hypothetical protein
MIEVLELIGAALLLPGSVWVASVAWRDRRRAMPLSLQFGQAPARAGPAFLTCMGICFSCSAAMFAVGSGAAAAVLALGMALGLVLAVLLVFTISRYNRPRALVPPWARRQRGSVDTRRPPTREHAEAEHEITILELEDGSWLAGCSCDWLGAAHGREAEARDEAHRHCPLVTPETVRPFAT